MTPADHQVRADLAEIGDGTDPEAMWQYLAARPQLVESLLALGDWTAPDLDQVHRMLQPLHRVQQAVLARGGGELVVTVGDGPDARTYTTWL